MSPLVRVAVISLLSLALFQLSEYRVCTGFGLSAETWSRIGYVAITVLPATGLHMLHILAGKQQRKLVVAGYATMLACIMYFMTYKAAFIGYQCTGNYVIFQIGTWPAIIYGAYYYGWLATALTLGFRWSERLSREGADARNRLQSVRALIVGYLVFIVPTAVSNTVEPSTRRGIPSIMCGFAVLFALIVVLYILPRGAHKKHADNKPGESAG